jgi:hypothetical protein
MISWFRDPLFTERLPGTDALLQQLSGNLASDRPDLARPAIRGDEMESQMDRDEEALLRAILHRLDEMKNILARMETARAGDFPPMMGITRADVGAANTLGTGD